MNHGLWIKKRWREIEGILEKSLDLTNYKSQKAFIKEATKDAPQLCLQVQSLFDAIHNAEEEKFLNLDQYIRIRLGLCNKLL